jgi:hypothetical protein
MKSRAISARLPQRFDESGADPEVHPPELMESRRILEVDPGNHEPSPLDLEACRAFSGDLEPPLEVPGGCTGIRAANIEVDPRNLDIRAAVLVILLVFAARQDVPVLVLVPGARTRTPYSSPGTFSEDPRSLALWWQAPIR